MKILKFIYNFISPFLPIIFVGFFAYRGGKNSVKNKEIKGALKNVYKAKKRQDQYNATPLDVKRDWLRKYSSKVSGLAKTSSKK